MSDPLEPVASADQRFVFMLHDRIVKLEQEVEALRPRPLDSRVRVLGSGGPGAAVFVRVFLEHAIADVNGWMSRVLHNVTRTDDNTRYDAWCCHHWSLAPARPFVIECLFQRSGRDAADVSVVAHSALDASEDASVEACSVASVQYFAESLRAAGGSSAVLHTWDPRAKCVLTQDISDLSEAPAHDPRQLRVWMMLHGWAASMIDHHADVWHPRALSAVGSGIALVQALAKMNL